MSKRPRAASPDMTETVGVRVTPAQRKRIQAVADERGLTVSALLRSLALLAVTAREQR